MREPQEIPDEDYERVLERVAAVDVAKASGMVCTRVPHPDRPGRQRTLAWEVPATTSAVLELGGRLAAERIQKITLEATSDYWRIWFYLLEAAGLDVQLVKANDVKQAPGRPKTDKWVWPGGHPGRDEMLAAARRARSPYPEWSAVSATSLAQGPRDLGLSLRARTPASVNCQVLPGRPHG
jgi:hypothetical protein